MIADDVTLLDHIRRTYHNSNKGEISPAEAYARCAVTDCQQIPYARVRTEHAIWPLCYKHFAVVMRPVFI